MHSKSLFYTIMLLSGVLVGTLVGNVTASVPYLGWLSYGIKFGLENPVNLNLGVLDLTFGISINLTVSCVIFIVLAMIVAKKVR